MYRTIAQPRQGHLGGSMQRQQSNAVDKRRSVALMEHGQLVEAIHTTDGVTREQAELEVTAFEKHFNDGSR